MLVWVCVGARVCCRGGGQDGGVEVRVCMSVGARLWVYAQV